jgi:hypothetical protein
MISVIVTRQRASARPATARRHAQKELHVPVNVGVNAAMYPNAILLGRGILSNRGRRTR